MILTHNDARHAAGVFKDFFDSFDRIDDYMRKVKMERVVNMSPSLPGLGPETDMFDQFDIHPNDMDITIVDARLSDFMTYMELVTSAPVESSIPGKQMTLFVKEKNTGLLIGMIRFGSPTINSRPRNEWLGRPLDTKKKEVMKRFNDSVIMGFNIVPMQPFGFNYLGGKLLAALCCTHEIRQKLNAKYNANICMFETTSLYGSSKSSSMYDGMKPILRFNGLTDSNFAPMINDNNYRKLNGWFTEKNGEPLVPNDASSRKLKTQTKMVSIIKNSLKKYDENEYKEFCDVFKNALNLTEKKRSFYSTYGYDNVPDYLNMKTDTLIKKENFDRFYQENMIDWWKKKAGKRYESLKSDGRLRSVVETWNTNAEDIDIIR